MPKVRSSILLILWSSSVVLSFLALRGPLLERSPLVIPSASALGPAGIEFYGATLDHDAFVWCLDRSGSMAWGGAIDTLRAEVSSSLQQLSPTHEFSLVAFNTGYQAFSFSLLPADPANVAIAVDWVNAMTATGGTCITPAVGAAIDIVAPAASGSVLLVGDGAPSCSGAATTPAGIVAEIAPLNPTSVPIHTFFVAGSPDVGLLLMAIADAFGGVYVDTSQPLDLFQRGDANQDGVVDLSDAVFVLAAGFIPGSPQPACLDAADVDDDGQYEALVDSIALLSALLVPGSAPLPAPVGSCGSDPTPDPLVCSGLCP